jgi:hypothetical protein
MSVEVLKDFIEFQASKHDLLTYLQIQEKFAPILSIRPNPAKMFTDRRERHRESGLFISFLRRLSGDDRRRPLGSIEIEGSAVRRGGGHESAASAAT